MAEGFEVTVKVILFGERVFFHDLTVRLREDTSAESNHYHDLNL